LTLGGEQDMFLLRSRSAGVGEMAKEARMARIRKEDHARILQLVDIERRAVRDIAAEFGCTPAAIYSLLTKLRRKAAGAAPAPSETQPPLALGEHWQAEAPHPPAALASPQVTAVTPPQDERRVVTFERAAPVPARQEVRRPSPAPAPGAVGGKLAKPGMGLLMRTPDGEETMTPFRSIDDLLSAIKPILRAGARSPEPVWFSLQPVDLSTIDMDAA
jgi:transposase-like protein